MTTSETKGKPVRGVKRQSHAETRQALEAALARLRNGKPKVVEPNANITVSSVAREARVHRSTVHNHHPGVVAEIQQLVNRTACDQLKEKRGQLKRANVRLRELTATMEQLQHDKTNLARINHALAHRNQELERQMASKDEKLKALLRRLNVHVKGADGHEED